MPVFLLAATAALVRDDIGLSAYALGLSMSGYFLTSATIAAPAGVLAERFGARASMSTAAVISAAAMVAMSQASSTWQIVVGMVVAGLGNGLSAPATNVALASVRQAGRRGTAFAVKQSAVPATVLVAGLLVPLVAVPLGWRTALLMSALAPLSFFLVPYRGDSRLSRRPHLGTSVRPPLSSLLPVAAAVACGSAAGTSMNAFYVETAVGTGLTIEVAGVWFAAAGLTSIVVRLSLGLWLDRGARPLFGVIALLWALGAVGALLIGLGGSPLLFAVATALAYGAGWAWNGVFHVAVLDEHPDKAGYASGVVSAGIFVGGGLGPSMVGALLTGAGLMACWTAIATLFTAATVTLTFRTRMRT